MNPLHFYSSGPDIFELAIHEPGPKAEVPESLVQEVWRLQLFDRTEMLTTCGKVLQIIKTGRHNHDQGPDFKDAVVVLDGEILEGDVEIHNREIDWILHRHQNDQGYNQVVLHVLLYPESEFSAKVLKENGQDIPNFVLAKRLKKPIRKLLHDFRSQSSGPFPCHASWSEVPKEIKLGLVQKRATDRFNERVKQQRDLLQRKEQRDEVLYRGILRGLGYSKNTEPMLEISKYLSLPQLRAINDDLIRTALLLGMTQLFASSSRLSGMGKTEAKSQIELRSRFDALKHTQTPSNIPWVNHRLRPSNRPERRVTQLAFLFSEKKLLSEDSYELIRASLENSPRSLFGLFSGAQLKDEDPWKELIFSRSGIGKERTSTLIANIVLPWLFAVAETEGDFRLLQKIEDMYQNLTDRNDSITRRYLASPSKEISRLSGEGLRELYHNWCVQGRCLQCDAGKYLLR